MHLVTNQILIFLEHFFLFKTLNYPKISKFLTVILKVILYLRIPIDFISDEEGNWSTTLDIFKKGGGHSAAEELSVPYLGSLPFDPGIVRGGDDGVHRIIADPEGETAKAFDIIVQNITNSLDADSTPSLRIT